MPTTWEDAIDRVASGLRLLQRKHGRDAIGVFGGGSLTNEKVYQLGKFARIVLRTPHIDYNGRFCMSSAAAAGLRAFGLDRGLPFPVSDLARADAVMLVGANVAETMPPIMQYFEAQRLAGGQLIVVDPRLTATARARDRASSTDSRHRRRARAWPDARADSRASDRRSLHPREDRGLRGGARACRDVLARTGRAADRRPAARHRCRGAHARPGDATPSS